MNAEVTTLCNVIDLAEDDEGGGGEDPSYSTYLRRRRSSAAPKPPSATSLAHLAHITTPLDHFTDDATLAPTTAEDPFYSSTTTSPMQSAAAMVGA